MTPCHGEFHYFLQSRSIPLRSQEYTCIVYRFQPTLQGCSPRHLTHINRVDRRCRRCHRADSLLSWARVWLEQELGKFLAGETNSGSTYIHYITNRPTYRIRSSNRLKLRAEVGGVRLINSKRRDLPLCMVFDMPRRLKSFFNLLSIRACSCDCHYDKKSVC